MHSPDAGWRLASRPRVCSPANSSTRSRRRFATRRLDERRRAVPAVVMQYLRMGEQAAPREGAVLVVDFGAQYAQLIARRVREAHVYSEIVPHHMPVADILAKRPAAIILSGGPSSVYADGAPDIDSAIFTAGVPVLGICYGFQVMAQGLGGEVKRTNRREFGRTKATLGGEATLFHGLSDVQEVWMSHGDAVVGAPDGFSVTAATDAVDIAAFEDLDRRLFG